MAVEILWLQGWKTQKDKKPISGTLMIGVCCIGIVSRYVEDFA